MTNAQNVILKYINTKFEKDILSIKMIDDTTVKITDKNRVTMILTVNIFCDIIEADTKKILAISDLPHGLDKISTNAIPTSWTTAPY